MWHNYRLLNRISFFLVLTSICYFLFSVFSMALNSSIFDISTIRVSGQSQHISNKELISIVRGGFRGTFLNLDLADARSRVETLAWVENADLKRVWPNMIDIFVTERKPLANWSGGGLVDESGITFDGEYDKSLAILDGPEGTNEMIASVYSRIAPLVQNFGERVIRLEFSDRRSWSVQLSGGTLIQLGREEPEARFHSFLQDLPFILEKVGSDISSVDLRYSDGYAVRKK